MELILLSFLQHYKVDTLKDVPRRWRMISEANSGERVTSVTMIPIQVKKPEPWMKYVTLLKSVFKACYAPEMNNNPDYAVTHSHHPDIMSTKAKDIKAPGRPRKVKRFTTLKKDFSKAKFHALYSLYDAEVSSLIKKDAVLYTSDPEGDGWCGYRAVAE
ncbi:hypothetical protein G6F70_000139 [Rhizopus microsporus]|nr:hypothetical protein G6F71_001900 [Rhizopus microsporus]KAG1204833.1 hypothetical protein G6F70_000139 [Rhizopus microsporus]KAG1216307.1 hypothetical protein G6F69_000225 [Rhizopus microsporus]KAG1238861.1 hypothetical protein G6F67_000095 [Rhizopus microsporus]KAG1269605.1 hypothetical protein G6F68_000130 [Rhizopus microsporus]